MVATLKISQLGDLRRGVNGSTDRLILKIIFPDLEKHFNGFVYLTNAADYETIPF